MCSQQAGKLLVGLAAQLLPSCQDGGTQADRDLTNKLVLRTGGIIGKDTM